MVEGLNTRLKKLRLKQHYTQKDVADILGVTRATISGYEQGVAEPPADILIKLASIYKCTTDYILGMSKMNVISLDGFSLEQQEKIVQIVSMIEDVAELSKGENKK